MGNCELNCVGCTNLAIEEHFKADLNHSEDSGYFLQIQELLAKGTLIVVCCFNLDDDGLVVVALHSNESTVSAF